MTKFIIVLHLCSMITGQCPSSHFSVKNGFETYYDCALNGYAVAQQTYMELKKLENVDADHIEKNRLVLSHQENLSYPLNSFFLVFSSAFLNS
jgi:hypothetical protein